MDTDTKQDKVSIAFINDKSPIIDKVCDDLSALRIEIHFRSKTIQEGLSQLSALKTHPTVCIIDLDFYSEAVRAKLEEMRSHYPSLKLIAHSEIDTEETVEALLEIGFEGYLLIGSNTDDFKKAIEGACSGKRYFSVGVMNSVQEYFSNN